MNYAKQHWLNCDQLLEAHQVAIKAAKIEKNSCGVYFLVSKGVVVYVGQSTALYGRIQTYLDERKKEFDSVFVVNCKAERLDELENAYIRMFLPTYNKLVIRSGGSDITIRQKIKDHWNKPIFERLLAKE